MTNTLEYTGERMVPEAADPATFWEHIYRYRFAARYVHRKRTLDIACGEGYGSAALVAAGAGSVVGVDVSTTAVDHARQKYGIDARVGDAVRIPVQDQSIDLVVSFETIEHVPDPDAFIAECYRVCSVGGRIVISTPNKDVYGVGHQNPFHCSEMTLSEFRRKLSMHFTDIEIFTQRPSVAPWWSPRWLVADRSSVHRIRGTGRLRRLLCQILCPDILDHPSAAMRNSTQSLILTSDRRGSHLINRYAIRRPPWLADEQPAYYVAVATKK